VDVLELPATSIEPIKIRTRVFIWVMNSRKVNDYFLVTILFHINSLRRSCLRSAFRWARWE